MTTLANVRAALRRVLEDTDAAAYLWTDAELNDWLRTSLDGYSVLAPRQVQGTIVPSGAALYTPTSDPLRVLSVEWPQGTIVPRRSQPAWRTGDALSWYPFSGGIWFSQALPAGSGNGVVWYHARHTFPAADGNDFLLQPEGDDYLVWGAAVLALERRGIASAKRRTGGGERDALREARDTFAEMRRRVTKVRSGTLTLAE